MDEKEEVFKEFYILQSQIIKYKTQSELLS
jgi:hypothetical protein